MSLDFFISWRYLVTKRKEKFISLISVISILGIAIGVMALIVVIAVMSGFDKDLREKIIGNYSHITVSKYDTINWQEYPVLEKKIKAQPHVTAVSPYLQGQVLVSEGNRFMALSIRGIDLELEAKVTNVRDNIVQGSYKNLVDNSVIIGKELAAYLGLKVGDLLQTYSANGKKYELKIAAVFNSGMYEYDLNLIFLNLPTAQKVLSLENKISSIAVKLDNIYLADKVKEKIALSIGYEYTLRTWIESNRNFFAALKLEKLTMFIILTLIILVAAFNIASTLIVMVVEKTKDIGILKAIGMNSKNIRKIFTIQGLTIGLMGTALGTFGGVGLCLLLKRYQFIKLPQDIYYIDRLPVSLQLWPDLILIVGCSLLISLVSTIYPAIKASQLKIVDALRYE